MKLLVDLVHGADGVGHGHVGFPFGVWRCGDYAGTGPFDCSPPLRLDFSGERSGVTSGVCASRRACSTMGSFCVSLTIVVFTSGARRARGAAASGPGNPR